jgi:glutathione reductase (NADPH)
LSDGSQLESDCVLAAIGRQPNTESLGLETAGVRLNERGAVKVDASGRTSVASIFAVGDVTDRVTLTPVALAEGHAFADSMYGDRPRIVDRSHVPSAVFSHPNVAVVGLTEAEARTHYSNVDIYRSVFKPLKHTLTGRSERTMMKLVVDATSQRVVGCHMVGQDAGEIIQGIAIAMKMGAKKSDFDATIGIHPTAAEEFVTMRQKIAASPVAYS